LKSVSKVVAAVIIIGITLVLSIALALYLTGILGGYSNLERLDIVSGYVVVANKYYPNQPPVFVIVLEVCNRGSTNITIDNIFVNDKPINTYGNNINISNVQLPLTLEPGEEKTIYIDLSMDLFSHGQMVDVKIHTASGGLYPKMVTLP